MAYEIRRNKKPPSQFLADFIGYLERTYGSAPTKELMQEIYPLLVDQWREGATYREAAKATCACERGKIVPSPGVRTQYEKGSVRPPRGAQRGDLFDGGQVRTKDAGRAAAPPAPSAPQAASKPARKPPRKKDPASAPAAPTQAPAAKPEPARAAPSDKETEDMLMGSTVRDDEL